MHEDAQVAIEEQNVKIDTPNDKHSRLLNWHIIDIDYITEIFLLLPFEINIS